MTYAIVLVMGIFIGALLANKDFRKKVFDLFRDTKKEKEK